MGGHNCILYCYDARISMQPTKNYNWLDLCKGKMNQIHKRLSDKPHMHQDQCEQHHQWRRARGGGSRWRIRWGSQCPSRPRWCRHRARMGTPGRSPAAAERSGWCAWSVPGGAGAAQGLCPGEGEGIWEPCLDVGQGKWQPTIHCCQPRLKNPLLAHLVVGL